MPEAPNHQGPLQRFYSNHPNELARAHRALLGGISDEAQAYMEEHPELAHHPEMANVRNSPKNEHLQRVKQLREKESRGPEESRADSDTDAGGYLALRTEAIKSGARKVGRREYRAAMRG